LGYLTFGNLWNIPDNVEKGFSRSPPFQVARDISCDDLIAAAKAINLDDEESGIDVSTDDGSSEALSEGSI
jgi:hypothetical protein